MPRGQIPTIVHLDADAFFISVEQALNPRLRGLKCAVGGRVRGIISSASYEARACGVYTPMPTARALKVCPDLVMVPHTSGRYGEYSGRMFALCESLTPVLQRNSIDEGYLDLSGRGYRTLSQVEAAVRGLRDRIRDDLGISVSFGIAANKLVSQIASKERKPSGFVVVPHGAERGFLAPLPASRLPGIGQKTAAELERRLKVRSVADLLSCPESALRSFFGRGWREVRAMALGEDDRPVEVDRDEAKSYSEQETFGRDIADRNIVEGVLKRMIDDLLAAIRFDGKRVRTMTVRVRHPDFSEASAGRTLARGSDLSADFYPLVRPLLAAAWKVRRPLRLVGVQFSGVAGRDPQLELFADSDERRRLLAEAVDRLNAGGATRVMQGHRLLPRPGSRRA